MDWAAIAAVAAAVTAVVTAIAAVTGQLAKLWAAVGTRRDEPEQRLRRATTPDEARGVFLDAGRDGIQSLKALDIDIAAGHFAQVPSSEDVARAEQQAQTVRKKVAFMRAAAENAHDRLSNGANALGKAAQRSAASVEDALGELAPLARPGVMADHSTLSEIRKRVRDYVIAAEAALSEVSERRPH